MISWIILGLLSAFFAALVAIFGKIGIAHIDSTVATAVRAIIMALTLVAVVFTSGKIPLLKTIDSRALLFIILSALSGAASWLVYFLALRLGPAGKVAALDRLSFVFVILLAVFIGERLTFTMIVGALLMLIGAWIIVSP